MELKTLKDIKINHPAERGYRRELKVCPCCHG